MVREFGRIVDQIIEYLLNFTHIRIDEQFLTGEDKVESQPLFLACSFKGEDRCLDHAVDVKVCQIENHAAVASKLVEIKDSLG